MESIQNLYNSTVGDSFVLAPGEYNGPLVVNRPCVIDGCHSTLWANSGPVLIVSSSNVTIKNLRIEVIGEQVSRDSFIAIKTNDPYTKLENVEVRGDVIGIAQEEEHWELPGIIALGDFAADKENTFSVNLQSSANAVIECGVKGLRIFPEQLVPGQNALSFTTDELRNNTIIYGEVFIKTSVTRRIYVTGKAMQDAQFHNEAIPVSNVPPVSLPVQMESPADIIAPQTSTVNAQSIKKGQRISLKDSGTSLLKIVFDYQSASEMDIDSYCFLLGEDGKVSRDEDLIFFGNAEAADKSIKTSVVDSKQLATIDLGKMESRVSKIAVCYSIYGDNPSQIFSKVKHPMVRVFLGDVETYNFELTDLFAEKTVVATEIYRYKGEWKINFIGAGYNSGLRKLCESYGVNVE